MNSPEEPNLLKQAFMWTDGSWLNCCMFVGWVYDFTLDADHLSKWWGLKWLDLGDLKMPLVGD